MSRPITGPLTAICKQCRETFAFKFYGSESHGHYNRKQKFCSRSCAHEARRSKYIDKNGYVVTNWSRDGKRAYVVEHRSVMELHLGRTLSKHETVHHKNGNRADNRIENLELWSSRHGKGQRVEDKIAFCLSFLCEHGIPTPSLNASEAARGIAGLV